MTGRIEESATDSPETPSTSSPGLTTAPGSDGSPIRHVPQWWL